MNRVSLFLFLISISAHADLPLSYEGDLEIQQLNASKYPSTQILAQHKSVAFELKEAVPPQNLWEAGYALKLGQTHYAVMVSFRDKAPGKDYVKLSYGLWRTDEVTSESGKKFMMGHLVCGDTLLHKSVDDLKLFESVDAKSSCTDASLLRIRMTLRKKK